MCVSCAVVLGVQLLMSCLLHAPSLKPVDDYAVEVVPDDDVGERLSRGSQLDSQQVIFTKRQHLMGCLDVPSSVLINNATPCRAAERLGTWALYVCHALWVYGEGFPVQVQWGQAGRNSIPDALTRSPASSIDPTANSNRQTAREQKACCCCVQARSRRDYVTDRDWRQCDRKCDACRADEEAVREQQSVREGRGRCWPQGCTH